MMLRIFEFINDVMTMGMTVIVIAALKPIGSENNII